MKDYKKMLELHMLYLKNGYVHWTNYANEYEHKPELRAEFIAKRSAYYRMIDSLQFILDNYDEALSNCTDEVKHNAKLYDEHFWDL